MNLMLNYNNEVYTFQQCTEVHQRYRLTSAGYEMLHCYRDCNRFGRLQQLHVLRAVHDLAGGRIIQFLKERYNIDVTGV